MYRFFNDQVINDAIMGKILYEELREQQYYYNETKGGICVNNANCPTDCRALEMNIDQIRKMQ